MQCHNDRDPGASLPTTRPPQQHGSLCLLEPCTSCMDEKWEQLGRRICRDLCISETQKPSPLSDPSWSGPTWSPDEEPSPKQSPIARKTATILKSVPVPLNPKTREKPKSRGGRQRGNKLKPVGTLCNE